MLEFDESWYLASYSDVAHAVRAGSFKSALQHYLSYGKEEGRFPKAPANFFRRVTTYGSYGSNNVGDEAILEGVRLHYPDATQIYIVKPRDDSPSVHYQSIISGDGYFQRGDYLIIGGGGLLYNKDTVDLMSALARMAVKAGATVDILRLGCEAADESYFESIRELFSLARFASVRSTTSQDIIESITGLRPMFQQDFALQLRSSLVQDSVPLAPLFPTVGIVLDTIDEPNLRNIANGILPYLKHGSLLPLNFVFIPHSMSYFDASNNDVITASLMRDLLTCEDGVDMGRFIIRDFTSDPFDVIAAYSKLDGVISKRYHGLVFAELTNTPCLALFGFQRKVQSFLIDFPRSDLFDCSTPEIFKRCFDEFASHISSQWLEKRS